MSRFRKKPVEIEAVQFIAPTLTDGRSNADYLARWCGGRVASDAKPSDPTDIAWRIDIPTLEGVMQAKPGDWIIKGIQGEFYPCKPDIFAETYEPVEDR